MNIHVRAFSRFPTVRGDKPAPAFPHSQPLYHPSEGNTCEATGKSQSFSRTLQVCEWFRARAKKTGRIGARYRSFGREFRYLTDRRIT